VEKEYALTLIAGGGPGADISADGRITAFTKGAARRNFLIWNRRNPLRCLLRRMPGRGISYQPGWYGH